MIIRRSQRHEGERLIAIWCRSVDATHDFLSAQDRADIEVQVHHLEALFVDPDTRGTGVGRRMVEHALSLIPDLTTDVNEQNAQAVGFYQKMGFVVTGRSETDDHGRPYPLLHLRYFGDVPASA